MKKFPILILALACAAAAQSAPAAKSRAQSAKPPAQPTAAPKLPPELEKAEAAIAKKDFAAAEPLLLQETKANPQDFRAWYDLGFVYYQTQRVDQAIKAYQRSLALRSDLAETHYALGHILLELGRHEEAIPSLKKAAELKPSKEAWMALGAAQEKAHPREAADSYSKAGALAPNDPEPHTRAAVLYEQQKDWPNAEREYLAAEKIEHSTELLAGLVHVYQEMNRAPEAEAMLREYLKLKPTDAEAHLQLGRLLLAQGKKDEAVKEFAVAHAGQGDPATQRRIAAELVEAKDYAHAASIYRELVTQSPQDADLRHRYGSALLHAKDVAGAEKELVTAANLNSKDPEILGSLAIAASQNNHFELAIKALDARAKIIADTPATYFLRATSYDHLRQYKPAAENYRLFLAAANGAYPDEEWKARHRLIAIEPDGGKKKK